MTTAELLARMLAEAGVRWVFGIPSGPVLPLIEALRNSPVEFVLTASETSAGFMAATVGHLTGILGVCASTLGPGATNLATGVGAAWLDRAPLLAITCNVATPWLRRRVQMRIDHDALFAPISKAGYSLRAKDAGATLAKALALAPAEPPGPVHLDLPEDVGQAEAGASAKHARKKPPYAPAPAPSLLAAVLAQSRRPIVITGLSFCRAREPRALLGFIERQKIPFISTLHAKGFLPESHPQWAGVLARARRSDVQALVRRADLIVAVGFDPIEINYEEWAERIPILHLSTEAAETSPSLSFAVNAAGDLDGMIAALREIPAAPNDWSAEELKRHREELERKLRPGGGFAAHHVIDALRKRLPADGILAYDVGAHTHQIATQWRTDAPKTCLATNGWSSMGYGMPAAYAAKLVHPERAVVGVVGDGCFQMTAGELALARRLRLKAPIVVLNDGWLGLMKIKQEKRGYGLSAVRLGAPVDSPPHYFGVSCRPARNVSEFDAALDWALALDRPSVVDAFIDVAPHSETVFDCTYDEPRRRLGPRHASLDDAAARHGLARHRRRRPVRDQHAGAVLSKRSGSLARSDRHVLHRVLLGHGGALVRRRLARRPPRRPLDHARRPSRARTHDRLRGARADFRLGVRDLFLRRTGLQFFESRIDAGRHGVVHARGAGDRDGHQADRRSHRRRADGDRRAVARPHRWLARRVRRPRRGQPRLRFSLLVALARARRRAAQRDSARIRAVAAAGAGGVPRTRPLEPELRHRAHVDRPDGAHHVRAAVSQRNARPLALLGESGARADPARRHDRAHRLGRGQRPPVSRCAQDRAFTRRLSLDGDHARPRFSRRRRIAVDRTAADFFRRRMSRRLPGRLVRAYGGDRGAGTHRLSARPAHHVQFRRHHRWHAALWLSRRRDGLVRRRVDRARGRDFRRRRRDGFLSRGPADARRGRRLTTAGGGVLIYAKGEFYAHNRRHRIRDYSRSPCFRRFRPAEPAL